MRFWDQHQVKVRDVDQVRLIREQGRAFIERTEIAELYQAVLNAPDGQRMLAHFLNMAGLLKTSQVDGDPFRTAWNEGRRSVALEVLELLRWNALDALKLSQARQTSTLSE